MSSSKYTAPVWMGLIGLLPMGLSCFTATALRDAPALQRTERPRTLQFSRYLWDHGLNPVPLDKKLDSVFVFRNRGEKPIAIGDIERSCGCMTPELQKVKLAPGETGLLRVPVELTKQEPGLKEFQLTVHYTDPQPKQETLLIKAVFPQAQIAVSPHAMNVTQRSSKPLPAEFRVTDHRSPPLTVLSVESTSALVTPKIKAAESDGHRTPVALEIAGNIPPGTHRVLVSALTDDPQHPRVLFPMRIKGPEREASVRVSPSMVRMDRSSSETKVVRMSLPSDWTISHVDSFPEQLEVTWETPQAANADQQLELSLRLTEPPANITEGVLTLHANDGSDMVSVRIELTGE